MTATLEIERSRAEQARLDFVGGLMAFNSTSFGPAMGTYYRENENSLQDPSDIREVGGLMEQGNAYRFGAFFERHNHAQMFRAILDILERQGDEVRAWLDDCNGAGALGSLELGPGTGKRPAITARSKSTRSRAITTPSSPASCITG